MSNSSAQSTPQTFRFIETHIFISKKKWTTHTHIVDREKHLRMHCITLHSYIMTSFFPFERMLYNSKMLKIISLHIWSIKLRIVITSDNQLELCEHWKHRVQFIIIHILFSVLKIMQNNLLRSHARWLVPYFNWINSFLSCDFPIWISITIYVRCYIKNKWTNNNASVVVTASDELLYTLFSSFYLL